MPNTLFQRIVAMTQLSPVFATQVVELACTRAGLRPNEITAANVPKLLEYVEPALALFSSAEEAKQRVGTLRAELGGRR